MRYLRLRATARALGSQAGDAERIERELSDRPWSRRRPRTRGAIADPEPFGDEEQVPDGIEERHRALDRGCGHGLAVGGGEFVALLGQSLLELLGELVEFDYAWSRYSSARSINHV